MAGFYQVWDFNGIYVIYQEKNKFLPSLGIENFSPQVLVFSSCKKLPISGKSLVISNSQEKINLGWLDFTKFGILLEFLLFTKKNTHVYQVRELGIFSCGS